MSLVDKIKVRYKNLLTPSQGGFNINNNDGYKPIQNNPDGKPANDIAKYTTIYHLNRTKQNIKNFRDAILEAEEIYIPHRVKMQLMYEDTVLNSQVKACMEKRKNLVLLKDFQFVFEDGTVDEQTTKFFTNHWFSLMQEYILDSLFFGYNLINWTDIKDGIPVGIKTARKQFISPDRRVISPFPYSIMGHSIDSEDIKDWTLYCETPNQHGISPSGYGMLLECANYEILLRGINSYNADYCERYGMPTIVATSDAIDDDERDYLEKSLENIGSNGYIIKRSTDEMEFLEYKAVGQGYQSYANFEERLNKNISKLLLGHADALDSIPGMLGNQGSDTPISRGLIEIETKDSKYVEYYVNSLLLEKLRNCGMNIPENVKFEYLNNKEKANEEEVKLEKYSKISTFLKTMTESGFVVDQKWVEEELGIKVNNEVNLISTKTKISPKIDDVSTIVSEPGQESPTVNKLKFNLKGGEKINAIDVVNSDVQNPYPNFHAARIIDPSKFQKDSFRTKEITVGITVIIGKLIGENKMTVQAYRFDAKIFTASQAKAWLKEHKIKYISFHPATNVKNGVDVNKFINLKEEKK